MMDQLLQIPQLPSPGDFYVDPTKNFLYLKDEILHNDVSGYELEYSFDMTPHQCREFIALLPDDKARKIDRYFDINQVIVEYFNENKPFFIERVESEYDVRGIEFVTLPMSFPAAKKLSGYFDVLIQTITALGYSTTKLGPAFHVNLNSSNVVISDILSYAIDNPQMICDISGRIGAYQRRADMYHLIGDGLGELPSEQIDEYFDEQVYMMEEKTYTKEESGFLGVWGKPGVNDTYRYEITWFATPTSGYDFLLKVEFIQGIRDMYRLNNESMGFAPLTLESYIAMREEAFPELCNYMFS